MMVGTRSSTDPGSGIVDETVEAASRGASGRDERTKPIAESRQAHIKDGLKFGKEHIEADQCLPAGSVQVAEPPFDGVPSGLLEREELPPSIGGDGFELLLESGMGVTDDLVSHC